MGFCDMGFGPSPAAPVLHQIVANEGNACALEQVRPLCIARAGAVHDVFPLYLYLYLTLTTLTFNFTFTLPSLP